LTSKFVIKQHRGNKYQSLLMKYINHTINSTQCGIYFVINVDKMRESFA